MTTHRPRHRSARVTSSLAAALVATALGAGCGARSTLDAGEPAGEPAPTSEPHFPGDPPAPPRGGGPPVPPGASARPPPEPTQPPPERCQAVTLTIDELRPSVTLLVDQSGSMREGYPFDQSPDTRWSMVRAALLDEAKGVVKSLEQSIQFGLAFYTSHNGFSGGTCPILSEVRSATRNHAALRALYDSTYPDDDTPTGAAIAQVADQLRAAGRKGPEVILLVTDGEADTCELPDPQRGQPDAIRAAAAAHAAGIDFYVLGISSDISGHNLQQLANAGQGKPIDAIWGVDPDAAQPYQASDDLEGLAAQLREILARVPLCDVALDREVGLAEAGAGRVVLDGEPLVYGSPDGFRMKDARRLEIVGKACEALTASGKRLSVRIACD